jgi:hypothetical protein
LAFNETRIGLRRNVLAENTARGVAIKSIFMSGRSLRHPPITTYGSRAGKTESASTIGIALNKDMTMQSYKTHNDLSSNAKRVSIGILNARLADAIDLALLT